MLIKEVRARQINDSRGKPTIEVRVNGLSASSPSGKSTGSYETPCWHESLAWNIHAINSLFFPFSFNAFSDLEKVEAQIKKTFKFKDVKSFGANALFALESALLKACAASQKKQLWQVINPKAKVFPVPAGNAIGGGLHSEGFSQHPMFQEFLLIPKGKSVNENIKIMNSVYAELGKKLRARSTNDEGAWQTTWKEQEVLDLLSGFSKKVSIGMDVASSSFYDAKKKEYRYTDKHLSREQQIAYVNHLINKYKPV